MKNSPRFRTSFVLFFVLMALSITASAKKNAPPQSSVLSDSSKESKTDYLEKIYFSGGNKEALTNFVLMTLQQLEPVMVSKTASPSVIAQYIFLDGIKASLAGAKDACAITDMLAAGIYSFDISEAIAQGIPRPEAKVTADLGSVLSKSQTLSSSASSLAANSYILSNGKFGGLGTVSKLGSGASAIGNAAQTAGQIKDIAKTFFTPKDKACKSISVKTIAISDHPVSQPEKIMVQTQTTTVNNIVVSSDKKTIITITGADYAKLCAIDQNIKTCATVKSTTKKFNSTQSFIEVTHTGSSDDLVGLILQTCKDNFKQTNITGVEDGAVAINIAQTEIKKAK